MGSSNGLKGMIPGPVRNLSALLRTLVRIELPMHSHVHSALSVLTFCVGYP